VTVGDFLMFVTAAAAVRAGGDAVPQAAYPSGSPMESTRGLLRCSRQRLALQRLTFA
jgi:hypothetical protein